MFGAYAIFTTLQTGRDVDRASAIIADLTSRLSVIDDETVNTLMDVAESLIGEPSQDTSYEIVISSISNTFDTDGDYDLAIDWSFPNKLGKELEADDLDKFDIPFIPEGETLILVNIQLDYGPDVYQEPLGTIPVARTSTRRPRFVPLVVYEN